MEFDALTLDSPLTKAKENQLKKKKINNVNDLLRFAPLHYLDYSKETSLEAAAPFSKCAFRLTLQNLSLRMGNKVPYVQGIAFDKKGNQVKIFWFDRYLEHKLREYIDQEVIIGGEFRKDGYGMTIVNPEFITTYSPDAFKITPVYSKIAGMSVSFFNTLMSHALTEFNEPDWLPKDVKEQFQIVSQDEMFLGLHAPKTPNDISRAKKREAFEDMYALACQFAENALDVNKTSSFEVKEQKKFQTLQASLPFSLTKDQERILNQFIAETRSKKRVNAMVQGDVGSGKTIVAFLMMVLMAENGYQSVLMAPTGILARQHYFEMKKYANELGLTIAYLGGDTKLTEKRKIIHALSTGKIQILIGTHSVLSEEITFQSLGLTVVDEEHKFGVEQREALKKKANEGVHHISMSATPIPRSLAQTIYSDAFDIYTISSMPNGRKPVKTATVQDFSKMFRFMEKEIKLGHQCYIVCPMIEVSKNMEAPPISVEEAYDMAVKFFQEKGIVVRAITGKMKDIEKDAILEDFSANKAQVLIATTIIEVGVNVPNATVISILNAERFGLAGLHQLRGRVGRSSLQSYCILQSKDVKNERLQAMCETTNGFEIAEKDLELRGTGDLIGTKQSGEDKKISLMLQYPTYFAKLKSYLMERMKKGLPVMVKGRT